MKQFEYGHKKGDYWCDPKGKFSFFGVPKSCSTSVRKSFGNYNLFNISQKEIDINTTSFTILRDPVDRCFSAYFEVIKRLSDLNGGTVNKGFYKMKERKKRFECYLNELYSEGFYEVHSSPQIYFITDDFGKLYDIDYFFTMESITEKLKKVLNLNIGFHNKSNDRHKRLKEEYLDKKNIEFIKKIYQKDMEFYESIKDKEYNKL